VQGVVFAILIGSRARSPRRKRREAKTIRAG